MHASVGITIFSLLILAVLFVNLARQANPQNMVSYTLKKLTLSVGLLAASYLVRSFFFEKNGEAAGTVVVLLTVFIYAFTPVIALFWFQYVKLFVQKSKFVNLYPLGLIIPVTINALVALLSISFPLYFSLGDENQFRREMWFPLYLIIVYFIMFYATYIVFRYRRNLRQSDFFPMIIFAIPTAIGGAIQTIDYQYMLAAPGMTLSIIMIHVFMQSGIVKTDYLTGLSNKRDFETYFSHLARRHSKKLKTAGIYIDLDGFKKINDTHGHHIGDQVLKCTADILHKSFRKNDLLARIGGDEFAAALRLHNHDELNLITQRIEEHFDEFNAQGVFTFPINYSLGKAFFDDMPDSHSNFFDYLDKLMYEEKARKKENSAK